MDVDPYVPALRETSDDPLVAENESLVARVAELEKTVQRQQAELMLLQTTSADLMRRLAKIEASSTSSNRYSSAIQHVAESRTPTLYSSPSSCNISKPASPLKNGLPRSLHKDSINEKTCSEEQSTSVKRSSPAMVNVSVGKSPRGSPLRKWMSHQNVKGLSSIGPPSNCERSGQTTPPPTWKHQYPSSYTISQSASRAPSVCSLHGSRRSLNNIGCNNRQPVFNNSAHVLQLQIAGRPVSVPVPDSVEKFDPSAEQPAPDQPPPQLEWAYGYRGKDVRNNVHYLPTGELIYFCGSIVVLYNVEEHTQRHYTEHTSDVKSICIHPNRVIVASGQSTCHQRERKPEIERRDPIITSDDIESDNMHTEAHVRIWDSVTLTTLQVLGGLKAMFEKAVVAMAFSTTDLGNLLLCIDESCQHMISVWNWSSQTKLVEAKGANDQILATSWHPSIKHLIVVCGKGGHLSFWIYDAKSATLTKNFAIFEGRDKPKAVVGMCFTKTGGVITGDSNGTLSLWDPTSFKAKKQAHAVHPGGIMALCISRKGSILSAGRDRIIAEWETDDLVRRRRPIELPDDAGTPRVIFNLEGNTIIVGTSRNTLFAGDFEGDFEEIVDGDFEDVICCLAVQSHLFVTASADGGIRQYNTSTKRREWRKNQGEAVTCVSVNPAGSFLALGFRSGSWSILDVSTKESAFEQKESTQTITAIQFSPNGVLLFVATKELSGVIYRLDTSQRCHRIARIGSLSSFIISLDWDVDSQYIRGNSAVGHIYHWSVAGESVDHVSVRNLKWASCNCMVSFEAGCVAHSVEGITSVSRSTSQDKLVIGRDNGSVRLYSCPVKSTGAGFHALGGHTHTISAVAFTGQHLITAGLIDNTLYQWRL